ncbi:MAG: hypothetical protein RLZZ32_1854 [Cyanobacteriota bacterium]|jgi:hypothetical protein
MTAPSSSCLHQSWRSGVTSTAFTARKQQALVLLLAQQLMDAQFARADQAGSARLWQEVGALEIDPDRITNLLYCGLDGSDRLALTAADDSWIRRQQASAGFQRNRHLNGGRFRRTALHPLIHHFTNHHDGGRGQVRLAHGLR